ncbi:holo-ACP synthase [Candidatus Albibeggiatoa sp. nov. BB20]|uniref:holo-ACP synthase n=1 Tax=Candidatus Albibeggiatoa sp. nov. BB20 TaxID=3162723 RepID=UPI0033658EFB
MIVGIGVDISSQIRIQNSVDKLGDKFLQRILTDEEITLCQRYRLPVSRYAGRFAVKEAFMKAIGTGMYKVGFHDIQVFNRESGAPYIKVCGRAQQILAELEVQNIHVSISHDMDMAVGMVVLEK